MLTLSSTNAFNMDQPKIVSFCKVNPVTNDELLDLSKLKGYADDKINVAKRLKFAFGRLENIVGKGKNATCQHFQLFPQCFQKATLSVINLLPHNAAFWCTKDI